MRKRFRTNKRKDRRYFRRTAGKNRLNSRRGLKRGGIRL